MSEGGEDDSQKTEDPTQHRLDEAQKKGQIPNSKELNNFFLTLSLALMIGMVFPGMLETGKQKLEHFLIAPHDFAMSPSDIGDILVQVSADAAMLMIVPIALIIGLVVGVALLQSKFLVAAERIKPKFEKISPVKGLKRMFSMRSVVEFVKGLIKITVVGIVSVMSIWSDLPKLETLPAYEPMDMLLMLSDMAMKIMIGVCCVMFLVAIADYVYQYMDFMKSMRMTKQEIKDEYKQQEGDPHIKGKLKALRAEKAKARMMAAVPQSNVIITNPTHFAVALKYETGLMAAPVLVAKGVDNVAFRIRDVAKQNDIPIVENPPLARALHASVELDSEIPYEHYKAVAEVIGYIYRLKGKMS